MPKYEISMRFIYEVETDNIEKTMNEFEFPLFTYPGGDDKAVFIDNLNEWREIK